MKRVLCLLLLAVSLLAQNKGEVTDFMLFKRKDPIKIGDVSLTLKGTDKNHQRYNIDLILDGQRIELKDQYALIPIRFYVKSADTEAHELVVTSVSDDQITGRIVSPAK